MAEVSAYFRVSYKVRSHKIRNSEMAFWTKSFLQRIIDNLPRIIGIDFLRALSEDADITPKRLYLDQTRDRLAGHDWQAKQFRELGTVVYISF